jgi:hypothetical protein
MFKNQRKIRLKFILALLFGFGSVNLFAQAKVELSVIKMDFINNNTCEVFIKGINVGDRQISMAIDFKVNAKNGDFITKEARVIELRKGKEVVTSIYVKNEKCQVVGGLAVDKIITCSVDGDYIGKTDMCHKVISVKKGIVPITN